MRPPVARHRLSVWLAAIALAAVTVGVSADSALAARAHDSTITGFATPWSVAFDAAGNAWIPDGGTGKILEYDPYPSQTRLLNVDARTSLPAKARWKAATPLTLSP